MKKHILLGTAMAAMLFIPSLASAEEKAPAADTTVSTTVEVSTDDHKGMMHKKGEAAFEEADANKDGALSLEEFLNRHKIKFTEIDADKNGSLSREEMKAYGETWREKMKTRKEGHKEMMEKPAEEAPKPAQ